MSPAVAADVRFQSPLTPPMKDVVKNDTFSAVLTRAWPERGREFKHPPSMPIFYRDEPLGQRLPLFDVEEGTAGISGHLSYREMRICRETRYVVAIEDGVDSTRERVIELRNLRQGQIIPFSGAVCRVDQIEFRNVSTVVYRINTELTIRLIPPAELPPGIFHFGRYHAIRPGDLLTTAYGRLQLTAIRSTDSGLVADVRCLGHWPAAEGVRDRWLTTEHATTVKVGDQLLVPYKGDRVDAYRIFHIVAPDTEHEIPGWVLFDPLIHPSDPLPEELTAEQLADPCCSEFDPDPAIVTHDFTAPPEARKN